MSGFLFRWLVNIFALLAVVHIVQGISADRLQTTALAALVLGLINVFLKPLIIALTLPLNIISLGFFTLIINGFLFYLASKIVPGFNISGFWSAFWGALLFSLLSFIFNLFLGLRGVFGIGRNNFGYPGKPCNRQAIDVEAKVEDTDKENREKEG